MDKADDLAFARFLQEQFNNESDDMSSTHESPIPSSLVDEAWEVIDPNPDVRQLFLQFNDEYFDSLLGGVEVRWSPRMTLCAGVCCYEGRGGLCSIRLSEPLLKLRPRKDLVQTLLHEMIHAVLFVTQNNKDHDGHGPEFHKHMYRINQLSGTNITVYHNFHDEVNSYRLHWWKCNGRCQKWSPFYGVVKRAMNRAPAPRDTWWDEHKRKCGGEFTKVKEPENYGKRKAKGKSKEGIKAGTSQEKRKQLKGMASKPELPTFFDKIKNSQHPSNISTLKALDSKGTIKRKDNIHVPSLKDNNSKGTIDNIDESSSDNSNENFETSTKKQKLDKVTSTSITPFAGVGHVLGGSSGVPSKTSGIGGVQVPLKSINIHKYSGKDNLPQSSQTPLTVVSRNKTLNNVKKKKDGPPSSYTIVDAFKRSNKDMQTSQVSQSSSPDGSRHKPITLCDDTPGVMQSLAGSSSDVSCPVCQLFIPIAHINAHLDNCLPAT